ncbi:MAG: helix-turn-helix domain-containing protein [Bacteroides sp.]|nr:helix-turn-helix domain-containing protein [Bacteroides sp.]
MDGFELCRKIKSTFETSHIPVVLLTSLSEKVTQLEGLRLGADDYITKPFDITLLLQRIRSILRNREIVRKRALKLMNQKSQHESIYGNELNDKFVKKAFEVVHKNMSNFEFSKDEFASQMHVSPSMLYQKLKALTEQSPLDFIRMIRFNYTMELLKSQTYSITEISEMCGFSSPSYFSTAFRKYFGKSPAEVVNSNE